LPRYSARVSATFDFSSVVMFRQVLPSGSAWVAVIGPSA
jgi:hypothetical protein